MSHLSERPEGAVVGVSMPHESAALHVTGAALYTDDLVHRTKDVLHAYPVQVMKAHGRITALRTEPALAVPGVVRVLTGADVPGVNDAGMKHDEPLFPDEVMFHGHAVAWVLGETLEAARLGAAAVEVDLEELPSLVTLEEAIAAESFHGARPVMVTGDIDAGFADSAHVFTGELRFSDQEHFYLETHAALAYIDEAEQVFVQSSTQHPSETQEIVAHVLGLHSHEVTVQCLRMGGGFGGKEMQPHGFAAVAALGAKLTGRPVRLRLNRTQDLTMSGKRHGFHARWRIGFDEEGRIQALDAALTADGGWSLDLSEPVVARALCHIDNTYWIPHARIAGRIARTNKVSNTAFRGFGGPQGMLVIEDIMGRCAPLLGLDPMELRERNFYRQGQSTPYGQPVVRPERITAVWEQVKQNAGIAGRTRAIAAFNAAHPHTKRALAITGLKFGISFNLTAFNQGGALVLIYKDGSVLINHGGTEMGQGLHTKMLQVAATTLGIPLHKVRLAPTRTDKVPNTSATAASAGADLNGAAVKNACEQLRERLLHVAATQLGGHPSDVRIVDGVARTLGSDKELAWDDLVRTAYFQRVQLSAAGFYRTEGLHWDAKTFQGSPFKYFAHGAAAAEVEVDGFTGAYRIRRVDIVHDVGDSLSPMIDIGQVEGGFVQGAGWLTLEDLRWDTGYGPHRGRLLTQAASTYKLPSFSEMPEEFHVTLLENATEEGAVYGSKAVGEPPLMLAFSVREALRQAAAAFGPSGISVELASPATPEAVYWAIQAARQGAAGDGPAGGGSAEGGSAEGGSAGGAQADGGSAGDGVRVDADAAIGA
ncbi:xanthine dehydrogenase molybdopterin binding subunit [Streptomyces sp. WAC05374]|uniref:xanthine dehydrogenase molybdopterin binding subunit n=1 Tax=Streptomyces sp. WAC05374 TaxID=2487420 RepID=UPI000F85DCD0|nr:xanthine dehydrogenase molybdopterin binding subunit [Streptomyces sp. WAC05374]RST16379.1 xanthine dehydrogenase molybdopterin binding subunit [Streptomyces sp. WAC05374]TDF50139.1 xanthine dehydrogenase molybdopterin binding subunit [Streptomyces sp. WAC05374]TDF57864.1 xanthine dehydrogenase molybdopterin binding subunit [Streptomyces sp. WAC05374]TDF60393.1 xanthine dehydrogenase molybdopterin binding subunit [Streptomyces sp. WAC05374]